MSIDAPAFSNVPVALLIELTFMISGVCSERIPSHNLYRPVETYLSVIPQFEKWEMRSEGQQAQQSVPSFCLGLPSSADIRRSALDTCLHEDPTSTLHSSGYHLGHHASIVHRDSVQCFRQKSVGPATVSDQHDAEAAVPSHSEPTPLPFIHADPISFRDPTA